MEVLIKKHKMNMEDIKKEVLKQIKKKYNTIPVEKIIQWINEVPEYEFKQLIITADKEEIYKEDLFDKKISEVIDFLSQYKDYTIEERWSSYENNYFVLTINRPENLDEIAKRICITVEYNCRKFLKKEEQIAKIDNEIHKLEDKKRKIKML